MLWFGGDVHFGLDGGAALEGLSLDGPLVVNLEGPISRAPRASRADALFNPPDAAKRLAAARVIAAGVDNNHALDDGPAGVAFTNATLRAVGIEPLGATSSPVPMLQVDLSRGVPAELRAQLEVHRPTVLLLHVLAPPLYLPEPPLREAVELAVSQRVPAVLAHGSHALGAVERRGDTVIAWGLGNLAFDCACTTEDEGLLVRLELEPQRVTRATVAPVRAGLQGRAVRLPDDASADLALLESLGSRLHQKTATRADW
ncbi:MAG: CapA family protein [Myxococcaceae bacterium]|nr:CapA family protein [Myxococcaceae bacterium]